MRPAQSTFNLLASTPAIGDHPRMTTGSCLRQLGIWTLLCALGLAPHTTARAQEADREAQALYEAGEVAFSDGRFDDAVSRFLEAHRLSGRDGMLYNIALCYERQGDDVHAAEFYERYLAAMPDAPNHADAERRLAVSRERVARAQVATTAPVAPPVEVVPAPEVDLTLPIALITSSAILTVAGSVMLVVGQLEGESIRAIPLATQEWSSVEGRVNSANILTGVGIGGLVLGVVGIGAGVIVLATTHAPERATTLRLGGPGLELVGSF